eukprot:TRINITY_DN3977_c0_g1_i1.p2 TRINITY_DN3977_c0_g1~~TRINITY_DN3977_c0_g1_i1.p2  ORF type:complete len:231 (+),score=42.99 TRINITY_DN3977_c0_g1_i1:59-694(+)
MAAAQNTLKRTLELLLDKALSRKRRSDAQRRLCARRIKSFNDKVGTSTADDVVTPAGIVSVRVVPASGPRIAFGPFKPCVSGRRNKLVCVRDNRLVLEPLTYTTDPQLTSRWGVVWRPAGQPATPLLVSEAMPTAKFRCFTECKGPWEYLHHNGRVELLHVNFQVTAGCTDPFVDAVAPECADMHRTLFKSGSSADTQPPLRLPPTAPPPS